MHDVFLGVGIVLMAVMVIGAVAAIKIAWFTRR